MTTSKEKVCYHELIETSSEYKWIIHNFSYFNVAEKEPIISQIFLINNVECTITMYPNDSSYYHQYDKEYVAIYLSWQNNFKIKGCEFVISNSRKIYNTIPFKYSCLFIEENVVNYSAVDKFNNYKTILADLEGTDGILTVVIKFTFSNASQTYINSKLNLMQDIGRLLQTRENADLVLISSDQKEHKVHKGILSCRSKVFSAMFQHNMKESQDNVVKIKDIDYKTLESMLQFVYTGEIDPIISNMPLIKLLIAADKYELNDLKNMCMGHLYDNMNFDNVLDFMKLADTYNIDELQLKAKEYFLLNCKEILSIEKREKLKDLPKSIIEDLLCGLAAKSS